MVHKLTGLWLCLALVAGLFGVATAAGAAAVAPLTAISLTGGKYAQDFDTLASSGTSSAVPAGWAFSENGTSANATYTAGAGGNTGDTYSCEQLRLGAPDRADRMDFQISADATSLTTGSWTNVDSLDCSRIVTSGTVGPLDGNNPANRIAGLRLPPDPCLGSP